MGEASRLISKRIARLQETKNLTDRQLSFALGKDGSYINAIHSGKSYPSWEALEQICDYFGIGLCEFFNPGLDPWEMHLEEIIGEREMYELTKVAVKKPDKTRTLLHAMIDALK